MTDTLARLRTWFHDLTADRCAHCAGRLADTVTGDFCSARCAQLMARYGDVASPAAPSAPLHAVPAPRSEKQRAPRSSRVLARH